jgi:hypothetical protein
MLAIRCKCCVAGTGLVVSCAQTIDSACAPIVTVLISEKTAWVAPGLARRTAVGVAQNAKRFPACHDIALPLSTNRTLRGDGFVSMLLAAKAPCANSRRASALLTFILAYP